MYLRLLRAILNKKKLKYVKIELRNWFINSKKDAYNVFNNIFKLKFKIDYELAISYHMI